MLLDVNPNNILLSNIDAPLPIVKLGDLDNGGLPFPEFMACVMHELLII